MEVGKCQQLVKLLFKLYIEKASEIEREIFFNVVDLSLIWDISWSNHSAIKSNSVNVDQHQIVQLKSYIMQNSFFDK